jgi:hypothetical protein
MGKKNLIFLFDYFITSPLFPIETTLPPNTIRKKKEGKEKTCVYPAKVRTTKPLTNTSESVAK